MNFDYKLSCRNCVDVINTDLPKEDNSVYSLLLRIENAVLLIKANLFDNNSKVSSNKIPREIINLIVQSTISKNNFHIQRINEDLNRNTCKPLSFLFTTLLNLLPEDAIISWKCDDKSPFILELKKTYYLGLVSANVLISLGQKEYDGRYSYQITGRKGHRWGDSKNRNALSFLNGVYFIHRKEKDWLGSGDNSCLNSLSLENLSEKNIRVYRSGHPSDISQTNSFEEIRKSWNAAVLIENDDYESFLVNKLTITDTRLKINF